MTADKGDYRALLRQKRFLGEIEQGIRLANREIIDPRIPSLNRDTVLTFAIAVARLRANYLEAAFRLGINEHGEAPDPAEIEELRRHREMFQEALHAFRALREAIERGYVDVDVDGDGNDNREKIDQ